MDALDAHIIMETNYLPIGDRKIFSNAVKTANKIPKRRLDTPGYSYFGSRRYYRNDESGYKGHEYDLFEYSRIIDTEAIVARAFERKRALIFKNGYFFKSNNDANIKYIKQRLREIEYVSGVTFKSFVEELTNNLIMFHNAYVVLVRDKDKSNGKTVFIDGNEVEPIAGWFNLPTESMQRKIKPNGEISVYRQYIDSNNFRVFKPEKIAHLTYNKRTGFTMGTPPLESVKDDIMALRRIEESVETLIYKSLFPLIHVKVGTESKPATILSNGEDEVASMTSVMSDLDDYGGVTTNERVEIKAIGAESLALRVESYLEYFKDRVMLGLGVSDLDMGIGDSSGKATGQIVSQTLKEAVINMQHVIADFITHRFFKPLLVESGMYSAEYEISDEDLVSFEFNNVDQDSQIKSESHILNMFNSGLLTFNEARKENGYRELSEEQIKNIGKDKQNILPPAEVDLTKASAESTRVSTHAVSIASKESNSSGNSTKSEGSKSETKSKVSPTNQYSDSLELCSPIDLLDSIAKSKSDINITSQTISNYLKCSIDKTNIFSDNIIDDISSLAALEISELRDNENTIKDIDNILFDTYITLGDLV